MAQFYHRSGDCRRRSPSSLESDTSTEVVVIHATLLTVVEPPPARWEAQR